MLLNDVRYALRLLGRAPLFTLTVLCTVALAIGANIAIFSVVNAVMLRPLPFRDSGRLVQIAEKNDRLNLPSFGASVLNFLQQIVGEGMRIVLAGIAIGVACGLALGRVLSGLVYGVRIYDPLIFTSVVIMLTAVAFAACSIPATRAAKVQPIIALRYE
jgi:FtsX-like permease family protein